MNTDVYLNLLINPLWKNVLYMEFDVFKTIFKVLYGIVLQLEIFIHFFSNYESASFMVGNPPCIKSNICFDMRVLFWNDLLWFNL